MAGSIAEDSRDQSWSPEVDVNRLRQMARGEPLPPKLSR